MLFFPVLLKMCPTRYVVNTIRAHILTLTSVQVKYAVDNNLEIAIKGGGHSCSGASSSEDLVIDLRHFSGATVDTEKQLITVGGGAIWETVDKEAAKFGLATVGGTVNHTGKGRETQWL